METETFLRLIREVQKRPILYDLKHPARRNYKLREQAWNEVSKYSGGSGDEKGGVAMKQKWRILRARYIRALKRKKSPSAEKNTMLFPYEFAMDFVKPYIIPALKSLLQFHKVQKTVPNPVILNGKDYFKFMKYKPPVTLASEVADEEEIVEDSGHSSATLSVYCDDSNQGTEQQELIDVYMEVLDDENRPPSENLGASSPATQKNVPSRPIKAKGKNFVDIHKLPKSLGIYKVTNISDSAEQVEIIKEASRNSPKINEKDVPDGVINLSFNEHIIKEEENRRKLQIDDNESCEITTGDTGADKSTGNHTENNKETDKENVIERNNSALNVIDLSTEEEIEIMAIEVLPKVVSIPVDSNDSQPDSAFQNPPRKVRPVNKRQTMPVNHESILPFIKAKKRGIDGRFCECNRDATYDGEIDEFFRCISLSVCRLGPLISTKLKKDISNLVINAEISDLND